MLIQQPALSTTCIVTKSNNIEWLGFLVFLFFPVVVFLCGLAVRFLCKLSSVSNVLFLHSRLSKRDVSIEYVQKSFNKLYSGYCCTVSWTLTCLITSAVGACSWHETYDSYHSSELTPYLWSVLYSNLVLCFFWLLSLYALKKYFVLSYIFTLLSFFLSVATTVLVFIASSEHDGDLNWCAWLSLLQFVSVVLMATETYHFSHHYHTFQLYKNSYLKVKETNTSLLIHNTQGEQRHFSAY